MKKHRYTVYQALTDCAKLWFKIASICEGKVNWNLSVKSTAANAIGMPKNMGPNYCPCCHYTGTSECAGVVLRPVKPEHTGCPLYALWPDGCCSKLSPYTEFMTAITLCNPERMRKAALVIAKAAEAQASGLKPTP